MFIYMYTIDQKFVINNKSQRILEESIIIIAADIADAFLQIVDKIH